MNPNFCDQCGVARKPTQKPVEEFGDIDCISMSQHRPILKTATESGGGQLLASYGVWRNGGTDFGKTHICDDCILVGLKNIARRVEAAIKAISGVIDDTEKR